MAKKLKNDSLLVIPSKAPQKIVRGEARNLAKRIKNGRQRRPRFLDSLGSLEMTRLFSYLNFPYISRNITAVTKALLIINLFLVLTIFYLFPSKPFNAVPLFQPKNYFSHLSLINQFIKNHQYNEAEKETLVTLRSFPKDKTLANKLQEVKTLKNRFRKIKEEIKGWQKIVETRPNYRDGFFKLAVLNYQIFKDKESKNYLEKTLSLDPNFTPAKELFK